MEELHNALTTLYASVDRNQKLEANSYLEEFQKSAAAWQICFQILNTVDSSIESKLFAAQTLRQKIVYDFHQLPKSVHAELRDSMLQLFISSKDSPRPLLISFAVCMAAIALHMTEWHNVINDVFQACSSHDPTGRCILQFLSVLPEEAADPRKTSLTWEELCTRIDELLRDNGPAVLELLLQYVNSNVYAGGSSNVDLNLVLTSLTSWLREIPLEKVLSSPLIELAFRSLDDDMLIDDAVEFLCAVLNETREVDESMDMIMMLYPRLLEFRPKIIAQKDDPDVFRAIGRLFTEAGESWVVLMARMPNEFLPLVESIVQICANDEELEAIKFTFAFWWDMKQMLELEAYTQARIIYAPLFLEMVGIVVSHLHYPRADNQPLNDQMAQAEVFFDDRESEDRFRAFRHEMGDVLKDCCAVAGVTPCLLKVSTKLLETLDAKESGLPYFWQDIEAPLFALRAMGRMVPNDEEKVIIHLLRFLSKLPENNKVRYAAILFVGRYTEWTAQHPEYLEMQLNYIAEGFQIPCKEVQSAAAQAMKHFCSDCREHLVNHLPQLHTFYLSMREALDSQSVLEIAEGLAHIAAIQPITNTYQSVHSFIAPSLQKIVLSQTKTGHTEREMEALADEIDILIIFFSIVYPLSSSHEIHPTIQLCLDIWPVVARTLDTIPSPLICERICKLLKNVIMTFREKALVLLPSIAETLVKGFESTQFGCFLWVSGACVREFGLTETDEQTQVSVWGFVERQCTNMFYYMTKKSPKEIPDVIDDFFRFMMDALLANPQRVFMSDMLEPLIHASLVCLQVNQDESLCSVLVYLQDLVSFALRTPPYTLSEPVSETLLKKLRLLVLNNSQQMFSILFNGMAFIFPRNNVSDASAVLIPLIRLICMENASFCIQYLSSVLDQLPQDTIGQEEKLKFLETFSQHCASSEMPRLRAHLQDWTSMYRRRVLSPRSKGIALSS
ncbi:karyopherin/importin-beta family nuclear import receptor Mtr10 [Schizosaccharomyces osmophilus]|uniref:Karyopherin/importin-beta family nuclear import receptor Mtr10 n=1 Tax=Schizosaccharomyces osmophilus TaxID=2545709 RepID=A0AAE9WBT4_9SCHI|nr:karyopherin/importin-beta family nuclear import receptor Mtr10 [Schizosaccharomyces osmophilus]WBW73320.1 karyopherin/importin-beta family nuclear import receptor Mtr10 [Schizosaccharomyces osmophilus]